MSDDIYYDITALPALGQLGTVPPLTLPALLEHLADSPGSRVRVEVLFMLDDLLQREAFLAGELEQVTPTVLTAGQVRNEVPLPTYLAVGAESPGRAVAVDALWESYYRHASAVAQRFGSGFLAAWVGYEVALRNAVAGERARGLGLDPGDYVVAADLIACDEDLTNVVGEWSSASTPLAGLRVLTLARWAWVESHDEWFNFKSDELAAYGAKLMLLVRWHRLTQAVAERSSGSVERTSQ